MRYLLVREDTYVADEDGCYDLIDTTLSVTEDGDNEKYHDMIEGKEYNEDTEEEIDMAEQECDGEYDLQIVTQSIKVITEFQYNKYKKLIDDFYNLINFW